MSHKIAVRPGFTMEPYEPEGACPKCGGEDVLSTFHADLHESTCIGACGFDRFADECRSFEHIDRTCRRCGYGWIEAPSTVYRSTRADLIASYEAKVQDFAKETLRADAARRALHRTLSPVVLALRLGEAPMFDGVFFREGYPPDELEQLRQALGEDEWAALAASRLADFGITK